MRPLIRGLLVGLVHVLIVASLGGKLLYDRQTRPRVWVRTAPVDPELPIRGRYVDLRLQVPARGFPGFDGVTSYQQAALVLENDRLIAVPHQRPAQAFPVQLLQRDGEVVAVTHDSLAYFIPEHVADPSIRAAGEELWVEVTVPRKGLPRPIRLGVKKGDTFTPLVVQ